MFIIVHWTSWTVIGGRSTEKSTKTVSTCIINEVYTSVKRNLDKGKEKCIFLVWVPDTQFILFSLKYSYWEDALFEEYLE